MVGMSLHELDDVSHVGEIFASDTGPTKSLRAYATKWREHILKEAFGMNRIPFTVTPMVKHIGPMASSLACSKVFQAMARGDAQSDITDTLNVNDRAILCKVPFQHCPGYYEVWDEMIEHPRCKVLYIRRNDPLVLLVSASNSYTQQQWQVKKDEAPKIGRVTLDPRHTMEFFAFFEAQSKFFDAYFSNYGNVLTIDFADLVSDWDKQSQTICEFIGLGPQEVEQMTYQQIPDGDHLSLISNLGELIQCFRGTCWEDCFKV